MPAVTLKKKREPVISEIMTDSQEAEDRQLSDVRCISHPSPPVSLLSEL